MRKSIKYGWILLFTLWSAVTLLLMDTDVQTAACTLFYVRDCLAASALSAPLGAAAWVALFFLYHRFFFKPYAWRKREISHGLWFSLPLAFVLTLSPAYRMGEDALALFTQPYHVGLMLFKGPGFAMLLFALYRELLIYLHSQRYQALFSAPPLTQKTALQKRFLLYWLLLMLCWLPQWIARFPGVVTGDAGRAIQQFFYETVRTADHPYGYTLLLGGVLQAGLWLGSGNAGVALFIALQMLFLSGVFAFTLRDLVKSGYSTGVQLAIFCFYAFLPIISSNTSVILKDIPFSAVFVGYMLVVTRMVLHREEYRVKPLWWIAFIGFSCLLLLLRHNGKMVVWPMTFALFFWVWQNTALRKKALYGVLLAAPLVIAFAFQTLVVAPALIPVDSTADMLGVPLQQTARIIRDHEESLTAQDRETIENLYDYDQLAPKYSWISTDPIRVKYRYFDDVPLSDKLSFLGTWFSLSAKHPVTAFHAFWALSSGYFDPMADGSVYYENTLPSTDSKYPAAVGFSQPEALRGLRNRFAGLEAIWRKLPFISQLNNVGLYPWLLLLGFLLLSQPGLWYARLLYLPILGVFIACIFAPGFYSCTRYAFPLVYAAPYLLAVTGGLLRTGHQE